MALVNVASILAETAKRTPDKVAMILGDLQVTYAQAWHMARQYATVLADHGVGKGDRVALLIPNTPHFPAAYYGALCLGASVVPVHALLVAEEIRYVLKDSGAKVLVCAGPLLGEGAKGAEMAGVPVLAVMDTGDVDVPRIDAMASKAVPVRTYLAREAEDEAVVLYTSGTTGEPKGAVLSHDNILWNVTMCAFDTVGLQSDDVIFGALPLFHSFGQTVVMNAGFRVGATIALVPRFDPATVMDLMVATGVNVFVGVPTMYMALLQIAKADPRRPALRSAVSGGSALPVAVIDQVHETFGVEIYEGYGLSETAPVATFNQPWYGRKAGSVGCAIWGVDVEIAHADLEGEIDLLGVDEVGEIVIRGHNVFTGYLNRPEATAAVMVDGWFRTGDLGYKDSDGFVFIVDRKKDLIIRGGFNVYPREVEETLMRHPEVVQVAVVPQPHATYGEEICAVVVLGAGSTLDAAALIEWSQERLGKHKYPREVRFVASLPLGPSGKILKREIVRTLNED